MDARNRRARQIQTEISKVLWEDWNPIGFDVPLDEYDAYVGPIYSLLSRGASAEEVARHLASVDTDGITGHQTDPSRLMRVAHKLREIDVTTTPAT